MEAQTVFAILVGAALACFSLVMVGYSFFRGNEARRTGPVTPALRDDEVGVDAILDSINTLDLEYQLGNVPEEQYRDQMASYRLQLALAVKAELECGDASPELLLEREILEARANGAEGWRSCPRCDAPLPAATGGDAPPAFCPHCDASLEIDGSAPSPEPPFRHEKGGDAPNALSRATEQ